MQSSFVAPELSPYGTLPVGAQTLDLESNSDGEPEEGMSTPPRPHPHAFLILSTAEQAHPAITTPSPKSKTKASQKPRAQYTLLRLKVDASNKKQTYTLAQRVQCLTLLSLGYTPKQVEAWIQVRADTARNLLYKARERGYDLAVDPRILERYVEDGKKTGRPRKSVTKRPRKGQTRAEHAVASRS